MPLADVTVRIKLDGKTVHEQPGFKAGALSPVVVIDLNGAKALTLDFYDRTRLASWVRQHPGLIPWVRDKIGKPLRLHSEGPSVRVRPRGRHRYLHQLGFLPGREDRIANEAAQPDEAEPNQAERDVHQRPLAAG